MDLTGMRQVGDRYELAQDLSASPVYNEDLAPTRVERRTWGTWNIAALWIGMAVCIPTYTLAAGWIASGMTWWQAVLVILLGNLIVLVPMTLNAHAGTKYGIPFPVFLRAPFGVYGSNIPALMRALVACGWFGIQTWIGGSAIYVLLTGTGLAPGWDAAPKMGWIGINQWQLVCFLFFWAINIGIILAGIESIKWTEAFSAPLLIAVGVALLAWGVVQGGGLGKVLAKSEEFGRATLSATADGRTVEYRVAGVKDDAGKPRATEMQLALVEKDTKPEDALKHARWVAYAAEGQLELARPYAEGQRLALRLRGPKPADGHAPVSSVVAATPRPPEKEKKPPASPFALLFLPALTAMVGFWATLSLNIADFTRYARTQKDQVMGQAIGLPGTMALYSFIGVAVTCAAVVIFSDILVVEDAPWDPVVLLKRFKAPWVVGISMLALTVATLSTNIAANVVSPANDFSNLSPRRISFRTGGLITGLIGILIMPWKLIETTQAYIFTWLIGYGALLGPVGGIMIADYYVVRRTRLALPDLYQTDGRFRYSNGVSWMAVAVLFLSILPNVPGFLIQSGFATQDRLASLAGKELIARLYGLYDLSFFMGFGIAFVLYTILGYLTGRHRQ